MTNTVYKITSASHKQQQLQWSSNGMSRKLMFAGKSDEGKGLCPNMGPNDLNLPNDIPV